MDLERLQSLAEAKAPRTIDDYKRDRKVMIDVIIGVAARKGIKLSRAKAAQAYDAVRKRRG